MYAQNYGQQSQGYGQGPVGSVDNGDGTFTFQFGDGRPPFTAAGPVAQQYHAKIGAPDPYRISGKENGYRIPGKPGLVDNYSRTQDALGEWQKDQDAYQRPASLNDTATLDPSIVDASRRGEDQRTALSAQALSSQASQLAPKDLAGETRQGQSVSMQDSPAAQPGAAGQPGAASGGAPASTAGMSADHVDPSQLSFGQGGTGGNLQYRAGSKGGWVPGAKEEKPGFQASSELYGARKGAQEAELGAVDKQAEAQRQATQLGVTLAANRADAIGLQVAQDQSRMTQQQDQVNAKLAELDRLGADLQAQKIDPRQLFHQVGALGEIGMAIAAGAGAFGQGLTGAPNTALEIINRKVDQNIGAQQANINNAKDALAAKRQGIQILRDSFATQNEQDAAHKVLVWKAVDSQLDAQKAKLGSAFDDAAYAQMKAGVQQKIADSQGGYEKEAWTQTAIHSRYAQPQQGGWTQAPPDDIDPKNVAQLPNGQHVAFPTEKSATDFKETATDVGKFKTMIAKVKQLRGDTQAFVPGTNAYGERQQLEQAIILSAPKTLEGLARFTEEEKQMKSAGLSWFNKGGALDSLAAQADDKLSQTAHQHQGRTATPTPYRKTPQSGITLGWRYRDLNTVPTMPAVTPRGE